MEMKQLLFLCILLPLKNLEKLLYYKNVLIKNLKKKGIPVSLDLFQGVPGHYLKMEEAMELLPEECQIYQKVDLETEAHKLPSRYKQHERDFPKRQELLKKVALQNPNMNISIGRSHFHLPFDFETRKNLLYVNWDSENKRWNEDIEISPTKIIGWDDDEWDDEQEVDKNEDELYPEILSIAIDSFRTEINSNFNF